MFSDGPSGIPPSGGQNPKPEDLQKAQQKKTDTTPAQAPQDDGGYHYLGYSFNSYKAYWMFKSKFLSQMANTMLQEIKHNNDRMIQALRKMRENQ